jgi:hypothetical protein
MGQNFIACDRDQSFLMPPDVREWLPEGHLAWFVIDAVAELDLSAFYRAYRSDGHGRAAYEPASVLRTVSAVSWPGVTMTTTATPMKASSSATGPPYWHGHPAQRIFGHAAQGRHG